MKPIVQQLFNVFQATKKETENIEAGINKTNQEVKELLFSVLTTPFNDIRPIYDYEGRDEIGEFTDTEKYPFYVARITNPDNSCTVYFFPVATDKHPDLTPQDGFRITFN